MKETEKEKGIKMKNIDEGIKEKIIKEKETKEKSCKKKKKKKRQKKDVHAYIHGYILSQGIRIKNKEKGIIKKIIREEEKSSKEEEKRKKNLHVYIQVYIFSQKKKKIPMTLKSKRKKYHFRLPFPVISSHLCFQFLEAPEREKKKNFCKLTKKRK